MFAELVEDLTEAVTGDGSPLAAALSQELGATLDTEAFVAPTTFVEVDIRVRVSTSSPTTVCSCPLLHHSLFPYNSNLIILKSYF